MHPILSRHIYAAPAWLKRPGGRYPALDLDFVRQRYFMQSKTPVQGLMAFTRATVAWYDPGNGVWVQAASGQLRRHSANGILLEGARTNVLLWNRDLTNAAWVAVNVTATKDQVGIDGVTNSASSIISTAGNGTILQTVVQASTNCVTSMFVKRITGSGTIQMTEDNGTTWTTVTVTSAWAQVSIPAQSIASPITGIRIVTSGDKIAVDMVQNETIVASESALPTSPIATTTVAVTRNQDLLLLTTANIPKFSATAGTLFAEGLFSAINAVGTQAMVSFTDTTLTQRIVLRHGGSGNVTNLIVVDGGVTQCNLGAGNLAASPSICRIAGAWQANDFRAASASAINGGAFGTPDAAGTVPTVTQLEIGGTASGQGLGHTQGWIGRVAYWPVALGNGDLRNLADS